MVKSSLVIGPKQVMWSISRPLIGREHCLLFSLPTRCIQLKERRFATWTFTYPEYIGPYLTNTDKPQSPFLFGGLSVFVKYGPIYSGYVKVYGANNFRCHLKGVPPYWQIPPTCDKPQSFSVDSQNGKKIFNQWEALKLIMWHLFGQSQVSISRF